MPSRIFEHNDKIRSYYRDSIDLQKMIDSAKLALAEYNKRINQELIEESTPITSVNGNGKNEDENQPERPISRTTAKYQQDLREGRPNMYIPHISPIHLRNGNKIE